MVLNSASVSAPAELKKQANVLKDTSLDNTESKGK